MYNGLHVHYTSNFNERKLGNLETLKELGKDKKYSYAEEQLLDEELRNFEGENRIEVNNRMNNSLNKILKENKGKNIVIVSHGAAIKFLLMNWCKLNNELKLTYKNSIIDLKSPSLIKLEFNGMSLDNLRVIV